MCYSKAIRAILPHLPQTSESCEFARNSKKQQGSERCFCTETEAWGQTLSPTVCHEERMVLDMVLGRAWGQMSSGSHHCSRVAPDPDN